MGTANLFVLCVVAIGWVFTILAVLALMMRLIILIFPEKKGKIDGAVLAAITTTAQSIFPGMKITNVEEKK